MIAFLRGMAVILPMLALLTWLLVHSLGPRNDDYAQAQRVVLGLAAGESDLQRDVLMARAGLLRNYDPLVADIGRLWWMAEALRQHPMMQADAAATLAELADTIGRMEALLEDFKSRNALLQNSLAYFDALQQRLAAAEADPVVTPAVVALGNAMLHLVRDPSAGAQQRTRQRLQAVMAAVVGHRDMPDGRGLQLLVLHSRLLLDLLPAVDDDLRRLLAISTGELRSRIRASQDARRMAEQRQAERFRLGLYGLAMLLAVLLVRVGLQWRAGLHLLRQGARMEALISEMSYRLATAPWGRFEAYLDEVLAELGRAFDADRAYLVLDRGQPTRRIWHAPGAEATGVAPERVLDAVRAASPTPEGIMTLSGLPEGDLRALLRGAGVAQCCAVPLRLGDEPAGLLGFERVRAARRWPEVGTGFVRMAGEVLQAALERRRAATRQAEFEARLHRARRLEAIGTFASGIAHNFNNVLGAMLGHAEMAEEATPPGGAAVRHIAEIQRAGARAHELVARILDFGARQKTRHRTVPVDGLLAETIALLRGLVSHDVELLLEPRAPGQMVSGDPVQLQQVLVNLVKNAFQAMPKGGRVTIQVEAVRSDQPLALSHDTLPPGAFVRIGVVDTGTGMDAVTLANIFRPFFTTKPAGTGLGLATVREIVLDHGGVVDVRTSPHFGSVFSVWLPSGGEAGGVPAVAGPTGQTVMLVGLEPDNILGDEEMIAALGYEPVSFATPEQALAAVQRTPDGFDAVLVTLHALDEDGIAMLRVLSAGMAGRPFILVTTEASDLDPSQLIELGAREILQRPLRSARVAAALMEVRQA
ncbi:Histidine kinase [Rhodovastum atsumiense]|uniref:histidine kinase n=1 Tax=Rhodovastum atsumiense TaxID=504468 RepID=A0A5M6IWL0_9PROT|nr:two-component system VirA-like sensor kinase [Rhodovastum atsumiense]KAA5612714.1 two-component system VirA-like sensor kinase [Rhodovastum atsumiense]CAH2602733.1 Histidine kinase [Rhodovastum atsumiense]